MDRMMLGTLIVVTGMMMASIPYQAASPAPDLEERHNAALIDRCITEGDCAFDENQLVDGGFLRQAPAGTEEAGLPALPAEELKEEEVLPPAQDVWLASSVQL